MSGYIGTQPVPQATQTRDSFTATSGQTSFATGGYTPNFLDVYLNGVKLASADYTASNGSDVVLASGASTGDILEVVAFTTFTPANIPSGTPSIDDNGNATAITIDSSENVGIGTSSPSAKLHVSGTYDTIFDGNSVQFNRAGPSYIQNNTAGGYTVFQQASGEAMRIDSSGNLLVGTTSSTGIGNGTNEGISISSSQGQIIVGTDSDVSLYLNRQGTDGKIAEFRKNGTTVGSIGTKAGHVTIGHDDVGVRFHSVNNLIYPHNMTTGATPDGTISFGASGSRFKDLYLSGGVYLGGTGSANKLEDYESGTFTPTVTTGTLGDAGGAYTKIGNTVIAYMYMGAFSDRGSGSVVTINNLPFTNSSPTTTDGASGSIFSRYCNKIPNATYVSNNSTNVEMYESATGNYDTVKHADLSSASAYFFIQVIYKTAS